MGKKIMLLIVAVLVLAGCTVDNPPNPLIDQEQPTVSITPLATQSPVPSATPTATQLPTATTTFTPQPTSTPFGRFNGQYVIVQKFKEMDLYLYSIDGKEIANLTKDLDGNKLFMGWSPDGKAILVGEYDSNKRLSFTKLKVWLMDIPGGEKRALVEANGLTSYDWSSDGNRILLECYNGKLCLIDTTAFEVIQTRFSGNAIGFSPDNKLLSWDNFPIQSGLRGKLPVKPKIQYGTLYTWAEGGANLTQVLSYSSYLGTAGTIWGKDSQTLYILDIVDGKSTLSYVILGSRVVKHLYQFEKDICAVQRSPDGKFFLVRELVVEENSASCSGALGLANLEKGELIRYEDLKDVKWIKWTGDNRALIVLSNDGTELMIDLESGAVSQTDWMNWTRFFELWALQKGRSN
jgi:WD40 repeat protein